MRRISFAIVGAVLAAMLLAGPASAQDGEAVAISWLRSEARPLSGPEPTSAELAPLVQRLAGGRIIGIGEATHGTHEDQAFKAALIRELVSAGAIDALALEASRTAGRDFDRYVRFGEGDLEDLIRSPAFYRVWRTDEFAGLIAWLREWNAAHPSDMVRVFGIDNQDGSRDAEAALSFLDVKEPEQAAELRRSLSPILTPDGVTYPSVAAWILESQPGEVARMEGVAADLVAMLEAGSGRWAGADGYDEALYGARLLLQNIDEYELEVGEIDFAGLPPEYITRRDRYMGQNLLQQIGEGERVAFWAHDLHVWGELPAEAASAGFTTVGAVVEGALGDGYRPVGFVWSEAEVLATATNATTSAGWLAARDDQPVRLSNARPGDLGSIFASAFTDPSVGAVWIDLSARPRTADLDAWAARPYWRGWAGWVVDPANWQTGEAGDFPVPTGQGFDVLVWFRTMTPAHRWPAAEQGRP